jgi:heme exporter protein B
MDNNKQSFIKDLIAIVRKDITLEFHTKEVISSMLVFALLMVVVFSFIFEPGEHEQQRIAGGVYWMALVFAGLLGLGKSMLSETSGGNLEALLLTPASRNAIFLGKVFSNFLFMLLLQAFMLPIFVILYEVNLLSHPIMLIIILATTYGFVLLGTLFSLIAARSRTREIMLPLLLLPVLVPILLASIQTTNAIIAGDEISHYIRWIRLIVVYNIVFTAISLVIFDPIVEE